MLRILDCMFYLQWNVTILTHLYMPPTLLTGLIFGQGWPIVYLTSSYFSNDLLTLSCEALYYYFLLSYPIVVESALASI